MRRNLALAMMLLVVSAVTARAEAAKPETTLRARAILRKYCAECHDKENKPRGEISVVDSAGMIRSERPFLTRGAADASQLLRLVEDGSMPPGSREKPSAQERDVLREWINANAADFPRQFDDAYVTNAIAADMERVPEADRPYVRYFSLHNLLGDDANLPPRDALFDAIGDLSKPDAPPPASVDPFQLVYRVDIRQTGWGFVPFKLSVLDKDRKRHTVESKVNLFDVILIEYPLARLDANLPAWAKLPKAFLESAGRVVPILYLRGDWFADEFAKSPVAREIREVLGSRPIRPRQPLARGLLGDSTGRGTPIVPLDAVTRENITPRGNEIEFTAETGQPPTKNDKSEFVLNTFTPSKKIPVDGRLWLRFQPNHEVWVEIVWTDETGKCSFMDLGGNKLVAPNEVKYWYDPGHGGYRVGSDAGTQKLTIYVSEAQFSPGDLLVTNEHMNERVIHPFYTLPGVRPMFDFNPAKVIKKTIEFTVEPKK
jgi:hypothetical protein